MRRLPPERSNLLQGAVALCAFAALLAPLAVQLARGVRLETRTDAAFALPSPAPRETPFPTVYVERDPFYQEGASRDASSAPVVVRAVASGPKAAALIEEGGRTRLVLVGDVVEGSRLVAIDDGGLLLASGARVPVTTTSR